MSNPPKLGIKIEIQLYKCMIISCELDSLWFQDHPNDYFTILTMWTFSHIFDLKVPHFSDDQRPKCVS